MNQPEPTLDAVKEAFNAVFEKPCKEVTEVTVKLIPDKELEKRVSELEFEIKLLHTLVYECRQREEQLYDMLRRQDPRRFEGYKWNGELQYGPPPQQYKHKAPMQDYVKEMLRTMNEMSPHLITTKAPFEP